MKIIKYLKKPSKIILWLMDKNCFFFVNDRLYLKIKYKLRMSKKLDFNNVRTFNEKLQWLKLYDRKDIYTRMVDKYEVKEYVSNIIGEKYLIPTIAVYDSFDEIDFDKLPNQFVIKCTHDSGGIVICKDKNKFDITNAKKKINKYLKRKYYYIHREWPYKNVAPRIIIERYMKDAAYEELIDYKVMCFNGIPKMIFTCTDRFTDKLKVTFFSLNWNRLPFERHYPSSQENIPKPKCLEEMIYLSKRISENIPFVRVDWYEINGKLYFGECTFFPGSGYEEFSPEEWDEKLGDLIELPKREE